MKLLALFILIVYAVHRTLGRTAELTCEFKKSEDINQLIGWFSHGVRMSTGEPKVSSAANGVPSLDISFTATEIKESASRKLTVASSMFILNYDENDTTTTDFIHSIICRLFDMSDPDNVNVVGYMTPGTD